MIWGAGRMTKEEIEGVGFEWCDCAQMMQVENMRDFDTIFALPMVAFILNSVSNVDAVRQRYNKDELVDGFNTMAGESPNICFGVGPFMYDHSEQQPNTFDRRGARVLCLQSSAWIVVH